MKVLDIYTWNGQQQRKDFNALADSYFGVVTSFDTPNVSIDVNHVLVDGYHVGLFSDKFQRFLNM